MAKLAKTQSLEKQIIIISTELVMTTFSVIWLMPIAMYIINLSE